MIFDLNEGQLHKKEEITAKSSESKEEFMIICSIINFLLARAQIVGDKKVQHKVSFETE